MNEAPANEPPTTEIAMIGLGKMGANMTRRLLRGGHRVVAHDRSAETVAALAEEGAVATTSLAEVRDALTPPRAVWVMVPSGDPTRDTLAALRDILEPGDVVVDGGNSDWREDQERARALGEKGILYVDAGVSGGVWGLANGYCVMVGGKEEAVARVRVACECLAPPSGFAHVGPTGAGHYSKMVHNAIEYGMMESFAEGFELLESAPHGFDLAQVAELWRHGTVIRSWLLDLAADAFQGDPKLAGLRGHVADSGEGRWSVEAAIAQEVPAFVLATSLFTRFRSRQDDSFAMKVLAALRKGFGGHAVVAAPPGGEQVGP